VILVLAIGAATGAREKDSAPAKSIPVKAAAVKNTAAV